MAKILDLSIYKEQTFDIILLDGTQISVKKPTQEFLIRILALQDELKNKSNSEGQLEILSKLVVDILNHNESKRVFTLEEIKGYDFIIQKAIIEGYTSFMNEVLSNPN